MKNELKQTELKKVMDYNADTGEFYWKFSKSGASIKKEAGCIDNSTGCRRICINGKIYLAHHLAILYMEGYLPKDWVGHINSQKDDNRFINIIQTTRKHRQRNRKENENNTSGYTGVYFKKDVNKWTANIRLSGKSKHLGIFIDKKDAIACRKRADIKYGYHTD
jgi:hypothetical protein